VKNRDDEDKEEDHGKEQIKNDKYHEEEYYKSKEHGDAMDNVQATEPSRHQRGKHENLGRTEGNGGKPRGAEGNEGGPWETGRQGLDKPEEGLKQPRLG
jgi:hypothetical protein